ncbi:ribbon-helix-helix domain-containing protein [Stenotrophomonas sp. PS02289]|uniref:ribbon-helix-helix domain-containing protein n=1 Tax=Stenotrophomonas sp. PS02289 TaxID=2991422 RepID=UPI002499EAFB|nr:ribbon-helix-helix domain-containing protein [Stenotrophomonas sp. PS02289]
MNTIRWNVVVSADIDESLRMFLASEGGGQQGDMSRFIEEAVRAHLFVLSANEANAANAHLSEPEAAKAVDEALAWACKR